MTLRFLKKLAMGPTRRLYTLESTERTRHPHLAELHDGSASRGLPKGVLFLGGQIWDVGFGGEKSCNNEELFFVLPMSKTSVFESSPGVSRRMFQFP